MNTHESVSQRLKEWKLAVPSTQDFKPGVWRRIEQQRKEEARGGLGRAQLGILGAACLMVVAISGWSGHAYARSQAQADREALASGYLAQLDARTHSGSHR